MFTVFFNMVYDIGQIDILIRRYIIAISSPYDDL
jgi:hypothetical protein